MGILDRYIIKKFFGTFGFMLGMLSLIVLVIDVQQKSPRIENARQFNPDYTVSYFLIHYYPFWIIYLLVTFMAILVFLSVIYFTSRIANNTEIVAYISSGASFYRFSRPYLIASLIIGFASLATNHFILPWSNTQKNVLEAYTYADVNREKFIGTVSISTQLNANDYLFISGYNKTENRGSGVVYQRFNKDKKLVYQLSAAEISWDNSKQLFIFNNYLEKTINKDDSEKLTNGATKEIGFGHPPRELFPDVLLAQNKTTPELLKFIKREREKGNSNLNSYLNELYQRTSMPVAIVILTFLALSLSSAKKRGGLGLNLVIGIALAFVFVFSFEALKVVSANNTLPPLLAMWLPNIIFAHVALILYLKRANQ